MREKAFTLIEVMVVMAIISILAGMMAPAVWKFWESEEIATTRQRMRDLKNAMVGDRNLVQNGIRTHYGFVGDNGELPFGNHSSAAGNLAYLVSRPAVDYPNWNGPYLIGVDSSWYLDAWGRPFRYTPTMDAVNRYVRAELRSAGPDGVFDTGDDLVDPDIQLVDMEVTPTSRMLVNIPATSSGEKGMKVGVSYQQPNGITSSLSDCIAYAIQSRYTTLGLNPKLPIGGIDIKVDRYTSPDCSGVQPPSSGKMKYFVNGNMNQINVTSLP